MTTSGNVDETPPIPQGVVLIARRNRRTHYLLPTKDSSFCGVPCDHVMIDSGCNTVLLPFPHDRQVLNPFSNDNFEWTINSSSGTGAIHCPVLKISNALDNVGVMDLPAFNFQAPMPFLRFHLGSEECSWLLQNHPLRLGPRGRRALTSFLVQVGGAVIQGRSIALLGQMILKDLCVFQFGKVIYAMRPASTNGLMNPSQIAHDCFRFANYHVEDYDEFNDLHDDDIDLYDQDGDMPEEQE